MMRKRTRAGIGVVSVWLLAVIATAPVMAVAGWSGPNRVLADNYPLSPSMVLAGGVYHVAYFHEEPVGSTDPDDGNGIFYASTSTGTWQKERVTTGDDFYAQPSLAIDAAGHAYIAFTRVCFCTPFSASIYIATNKNGAWHVVQRTHDANDSAPSLVYADGALHLAFSREGVGIVYLTNSGGTWHESPVGSPAPGPCQFPSLGIDAAGDAWIAYEHRPPGLPCNNAPRAIRVATNASGSWVATRIPSQLEDNMPDLKLDSLGRPHVIYDRSGIGLQYTRRTTAGTWTTPQFVTAYGDATLAIDSANKAHVAYEAGYATNRSGSWVATPLATYNLDYYTWSPVQIALTNTGKARVLWARAESDGTEASLGLYLSRQQ